METVVYRGNCLLLVLLMLSEIIDAVQVIGGNVTVVQGGTCVLPCKVIETQEKLTQVSWQRMTRGKLKKENFFTVMPADKQGSGPERFRFIGSFDEKNGSLLLTNASLLDEGIYTCIFTLFPSGNYETDIPLNLLVPPVIIIEDNHPVLGNEEVHLVTCTAAGSRPPSEVRWLMGTLAEKLRTTTSSTSNSNGTTTTVSSLHGLPTREIHNHSVQCVVISDALSKEETMSFTIQVSFPPTEVRVIERSKDTFECVTEANPSPVFTWSRSGQSWPQSGVRVDATLQFLSMTSDVDGLYQCNASNSHGSKLGYLTVHTTSGSCSACWTLFCLLLTLNAAAAATMGYLYKSKTLQRLFSDKEASTVQERERFSTAPVQTGRVEEEDVHEMRSP